MGRILLIGGAGLVGRHLRAALAGRDLVVTQHRAPAEGAIALDLAEPEGAAAIVRTIAPDTIIVAGAEAWVERCEREPEVTRKVNVDAVATLAAAAPTAKLVVFSSEYVFDGSHGPYGEDDAVAPINEYGRQKVALEAVARAHGPHLVCRTSGVFGWSPARTNFVSQVVDRLRNGERFVVPNDQDITPTDAPSLATAIVELLDRDERGTFHAAGPEVVGRDAFARQIAETFELDSGLIDAVPTSSLNLSAPRPSHAGLRTTTLVTNLGHGLVSLDQALAEMVVREPARSV